MGQYYYGNKISEYGLQNNRVDYRTLAKAFDAVLNNTIYSAAAAMGYCWESYAGNDYYYEDSNGTMYNPAERDERIDELTEELDEFEALDELDEAQEERLEEIKADIEYLDEEHYLDIFQYYIVSESGAQILEEDTDEIVLYCEELDVYLWCITHYGTAWDYVLTDIECNAGETAIESEV